MVSRSKTWLTDDMPLVAIVTNEKHRQFTFRQYTVDDKVISTGH